MAEDDKPKPSAFCIIYRLYRYKLTKQVRMLDLRFIQTKRSSIYSPRVLSSLTDGLIHLSKKDKKLRMYMLALIKSVTAPELLIEGDQQIEADNTETRKKTIKEVTE